jgi:hypothetical protein
MAGSGGGPGGGGPADHSSGGPAGTKDAIGVDRLHLPRSLLVLQVLAEEVHSADPTVPLPDAAVIDRIGRAGTLDSVEARALLATLEAASAAAKIDFPASLREANLPPVATQKGTP